MSKRVFTGDLFVIDDREETDTYGQERESRMINLTEEFLHKAKNLSDIPNRNTARENLGITVSPMKPVRPKVNDFWVDLSE